LGLGKNYERILPAVDLLRKSDSGTDSDHQRP